MQSNIHYIVHTATRTLFLGCVIRESDFPIFNLGTPEENENKDPFRPVFEPVVAEDEDDETRFSVTNSQGLFIETTTGSSEVLLKTETGKKPLNKAQTVMEKIEKTKVVNIKPTELKKVAELEKQSRAKDEDVIGTTIEFMPNFKKS